MVMHEQLHQTAWNGFWNFHDNFQTLSGYFQSLADREYNFQARLDPGLGEATYRGSLFNTDANEGDSDFEREILLHHESTYTMDDDPVTPVTPCWQRVWQAPPRPLQTIDLDRGERMRPLTRVRDAWAAHDRPGGTAESVSSSTGNSDES